MPRRDAEALALSCLEKMGLAETAGKRNPALSNRERFGVMVLRAVMVKGNAVAIDRPFKIVPELQDSRFMMDCLASVDEWLHECRIFDYTWHEARYNTQGWAS